MNAVKNFLDLKVLKFPFPVCRTTLMYIEDAIKAHLIFYRACVSRMANKIRIKHRITIPL